MIATVEVPVAPRLMDWTRLSRYSKAALVRARELDAEAKAAPNWEVKHSTKRRAARFRRDAKWAAKSAARLVLVRKGMPVKWSPEL